MEKGTLLKTISATNEDGEIALRHIHYVKDSKRITHKITKCMLQDNRYDALEFLCAYETAGKEHIISVELDKIRQRWTVLKVIK